jgi:hypothetical protein
MRSRAAAADAGAAALRPPALRPKWLTALGTPGRRAQNWFDSDSWYPLGRVIGGTV